MASRSLNKAMVMGNLVRDPELRYTSKGTPICTFSVATNREWKSADSDGSREDVEFHNVIAWSKLGELCADLLYKGRRVYIEGRLQTRDWVDEASGKKMYRTEIVAEEMIALGSPKEEGAESFANAPTAPAASAQQANASDEVQLREVTSEPTNNSDSADIPF